MIRNSVKMLVLVPAVALAACGRTDSKPMDDALRSDLSLAAQVQPNAGQQYVSPTELGMQQPGVNGYANGYGPQPYVAPRPAATRTVYRTRRASASRSSGTVYSAPAPRTTVEKHTQRDAIIGAVAGAGIGAVTSRNKVKGAVIGGIAGGILGAVVGNNVDKKKVVIP